MLKVRRVDLAGQRIEQGPTLVQTSQDHGETSCRFATPLENAVGLPLEKRKRSSQILVMHIDDAL